MAGMSCITGGGRKSRSRVTAWLAVFSLALLGSCIPPVQMQSRSDPDEHQPYLQSGTAAAGAKASSVNEVAASSPAQAALFTCCLRPSSSES